MTSTVTLDVELLAPMIIDLERAIERAVDDHQRRGEQIEEMKQRLESLRSKVAASMKSGAKKAKRRHGESIEAVKQVLDQQTAGLMMTEIAKRAELALSTVRNVLTRKKSAQYFESLANGAWRLKPAA